MTDQTDPTDTPLAFRILFAVPVLGWFVRDAIRGPSDAPFWFLFNMVAAGAMAVWLFGYPALITIFLALAATIMVLLVLGTWGG